MDNNKIKNCRQAFTATLLEEAKKNEHIFVVTSDARGSVTLKDFESELPEQFVEVGIAEQNAIGLGAGLARGGKKVFVSGPACFYSSRSLEQIKTDVAYAHTDVKVVGVSGGVSYGALGSTHHSLHDLAVMRTFPGLNVFLPCDRLQTAAVTRILCNSSEPCYMRLGRGAVPDVYSEENNTEFLPGKAQLVRKGTDGTIIAAGETVSIALETGKILEQEGISVRILDAWSIKPFDIEAVKRAADETGCILTMEEHSIFGGLGASVSEIVSQYNPVPIKIMGFPDAWAPAGESAELFSYAHLTADHATKELKDLLKKSNNEG